MTAGILGVIKIVSKVRSFTLFAFLCLREISCQTGMDAKLVNILKDEVASEWKIFAFCTGFNDVAAVVDQIDHDVDIDLKGQDDLIKEKCKIEYFLKKLYEQHPNDYRTCIQNSLKVMRRDDVLQDIDFLGKATSKHQPKNYDILKSVFISLCEEIGKDWMMLGRILSIKDAELDNIDHEKVCLKEKAYRMLCLWRKHHESPTLDVLVKELEKAGRHDLVNTVKAKPPKSPDITSNLIVEKFPGGCVFKYLLTGNEKLSKVEFKPKKAEIQWEVISKGYHKSGSYYIVKQEEKVLFVKVENFKDYGKVEFQFSFEDSKGKKWQSDSFEVLINEWCSYEISCNQLSIIIPDPCFSNQFPWIDQNPSMAEYLDWRDKVGSESKISKEKPIQEFAMEYFERNFVDLNQVICFPSTIDEQMDTICIPRLFTELFKEELTEGIRAVLSDYDLYHHATLLNFMSQKHFQRSSVNRVVIFYSKINLIFIVRAASSSDCINQESKSCSADVKYFASINKPVIEKKALTILGVVACCSVERKDLEKELTFQFSSKFKLYNILFLCRDELKTYQTLNSWWRKEFYEYCFEKNSQTKDEALFKKVIGLTMLIIAKCDENLPTLNSDTLEQINSLILNPEQIIAINDKELKKVVSGGFGFGKSVVGKQIVKRFYEKSLKKSTLYYICCDHFSLFQCEMKEFTDRLKNDSNTNVEIVCENLLELWQRMCENEKMLENKDISLPQLLQHYSKNGGTKVNFVLDELPGEYVREEDANQLKKLFSSLLKESLVVFIPKSIEKNRYLNKDSEKQILESTYFNEEKIGMKRIVLDKSMRVTKSIKSLIDLAQDTISKSNTILFQNSNIESSNEKDNGSHSDMETQHNSVFESHSIETQYNISNLEQQKTVEQISVKSDEQITKTIRTEITNLYTAQSMTQQGHSSKVQQKNDAYHDIMIYDFNQEAKIVPNKKDSIKQEDDATPEKGYHDYDLNQEAKVVSNKKDNIKQEDDAITVKGNHDYDLNQEAKIVSNKKDNIKQEDDATPAKVYHDYDLDQGAKIVSNLQNVVGSNNYIETQFVFKPGLSGHSIEGEKPKIVFLPSLIWTEVSSAKVLSVVLEKICFDNVRGTTVICNNMDEVKVVAYAIYIDEIHQPVVYTPHLRKYIPTMKEMIFVTNEVKKSKLNVLVADSRAMCGAESEVVIVLVKPEEYYLRHVIADICSRCNSYLIVFVLPSENADFQKGGTTQEVLDNWSEDFVEKIQVKISNDENQLWSCKDCFRYINDECKDFKDRGAKKTNFNEYIENDCFKINDANNIIYERMVSDTFNKSKSIKKEVKHDEQFVAQDDSGSGKAAVSTTTDHNLTKSVPSSATDDNKKNVVVLKDEEKMSDIVDNSDLLLQLEMMVGKDWLILGRFLSVKDHELNFIDLEYDDLKEKAHRMLCAWKNQQKSPTLDDLANAIYKINRSDLIRVMEKLSNKSFETENPLKSSIEDEADAEQLKDGEQKIKIARCLYGMGKFNEALAIFNEVDKVKTDILGVNHPSTLDLKHSIATCLQGMTKYNEALEIYYQADKMQTNILGINHPSTLHTKNNMAHCLNDMGKLNEALEILYQVDKVKTDILGINHLSTLGTKNTIAVCLHGMGKYNEALEIFYQVDKIRTDILGINHPSTLDTKNSIAACLKDLGKLNEALEIFYQVDKIRTDILGINHTLTIDTKKKIAHCLYKMGKLNEAIEIFYQVDQVKTDILGINHPLTLSARNNIAVCLHGMKKYNEALEIYYQVDKMQTEILGINHPQTLGTKQNLAECLSEMGRYKEALEFFHQVSTGDSKII